jgi:PAS domain S-box-containing protein
MASSRLSLISLPERERIRNLLKNPEEDFQEIISLIENKLEKTTRVLKESKERYKSLIEQTSDAVFCYEYDPPIPINLPIEEQVKLLYDCILIECNIVCAKSYGFDNVEDVVGRKLTDLFGTTSSSLDKLFINMIKGDYHTVDGVGVEKLPNGEERYFLNNGHGVIENGKLLRVWGTFRDITERKKAEQKLKESETKFRMIADNSLIGISIVQNDQLKYVNKQAAEMLGYTVEEMTGWSISDVLKKIHPEDLHLLIENIKKILNNEDDALDHLEYRSITRSGDIMWNDSYGAQVSFEGKPAQLNVTMDITEKKIAEQKLKESEKRNRSLIEALSQTGIGIDIIDVDYNILFQSHFLKDRFGNHPNKKCYEYYRGREEYCENCQALRTIQNNTVEKHTVTGVDNHIYEIISAPFPNADGTVDKAIEVLRDITDKVIAEKKLRESEENFRTIAEDSHLAITILQDDLVVYTNQKMADMFGYDREEMLTWTPKEYAKTVAEDSLEFVMEQARKKQIGDPNIETHYPIHCVKSSGEKFWVDNISTTIIYNGRPADLVTILDTTDKREAEQKLKESEEKFRNITEESLLAICIVQDDVIKYVNQEMAYLYGYSVEEVLNWKPGESLKTTAPDSLEIVKEQLRKKQAGDQDVVSHYQIQVRKKNGKLFWVDNLSKTIMYEGRPADLVSQIDITARVKAQQELIKLNQLKSELLRRTSHELKTPLVSIKGFSELLLQVHRNKLDPIVVSALNEIQQGCLRLENLIGDILKTAELESGTTHLNKSEEDLSFLVRVCVNEIKGFSKLRKHDVNLKLHENLITQFEKEQIHQVISNLLNNAVKYTPPSGLIEIKSEIRDGFIILSIKDNGIGFTEEEKARLFQQFGKIERYGQGMDIIAEGSGFGLFISKKIIELHGGKIWVESEGRNKGSKFSFSLPTSEEK